MSRTIRTSIRLGAGVAFLSSFTAFAQVSPPVPAGTMIAWRPPPEVIDTANGRIDLPKGWEACDLRGSVTPGSAYLKGVTPEDFAKSFDLKNPYDVAPGNKTVYGGAVDHRHGVVIPSEQVAERDQLRYGDGDKTHAANTIHGHSGHTDERPNEPPFAKVIWLCAKGDRPGGQWSNSGTAGSPLAIVRTGPEVRNGAMPSYAFCNDGPMPVIAAASSRPGQTPREKAVNAGECVGFGDVSQLLALGLSPATVNRGSYVMLRAGAFPPWGVTFSRSGAKVAGGAMARAAEVRAFDFADSAYACKEIEPGAAMRSTYFSACAITLPKRGDYRLCFPEFYVGIPYAYGSIRLTVEPRLIKEGIPPGIADPLSFVPAENCMDLLGVRHAIVLIPPSKADSVWDPAKVKAVRASVQTLGRQEVLGRK